MYRQGWTKKEPTWNKQREFDIHVEEILCLLSSFKREFRLQNRGFQMKCADIL